MLVSSIADDLAHDVAEAFGGLVARVVRRPVECEQVLARGLQPVEPLACEGVTAPGFEPPLHDVDGQLEARDVTTGVEVLPELAR